MHNFINIISKLDGLNLIEEKIKSVLKSDADLLKDIPLYLLNLGGKRMRPVLCLLINQALNGKITEELIKIASGIELIHMATLLHDDIIDNSTLRRGKPSALKVYGISNTLLSGDFLLVRAFGICAELDQYIIKATEVACIELTEGEILEINSTCENTTIEKYIDIASKKTASLFGLCAKTVSYLNNDNNPNWYDFGINLGIAFQILDDILDISSTTEKLGKPIGTDIREKKPSIVNLFWYETSQEAKDYLNNTKVFNEVELAEAIQDIKSSGALEKATKLAHEFYQKALINLENISISNKNSDLNLLYILLKFSLDRIN